MKGKIRPVKIPIFARWEKRPFPLGIKFKENPEKCRLEFAGQGRDLLLP